MGDLQRFQEINAYPMPLSHLRVLLPSQNAMLHARQRGAAGQHHLRVPQAAGCSDWRMIWCFSRTALGKTAAATAAASRRPAASAGATCCGMPPRPSCGGCNCSYDTACGWRLSSSRDASELRTVVLSIGSAASSPRVLSAKRCTCAARMGDRTSKRLSQRTPHTKQHYALYRTGELHSSWLSHSSARLGHVRLQLQVHIDMG